MVLLGFVSAVESYFRELLRRIISVDECSARTCDYKPVTFGAARVHTVDMLPAAILEAYNFSSSSNIKRAYKELLGINFDRSNNKLYSVADVNDALKAFKTVCELRHCVVHRFGKIGTQNAINLNLLHKKEIIEKPIIFDYSTMQIFLAICTDMIKIINHSTFNLLLERLILDSNGKVVEDPIWTWNFHKDRYLFDNYVSIFESKEYPEQSMNPGLTKQQKLFMRYKQYRDFYIDLTN